MNVQSVGCQPIKPNYSQSFGCNRDDCNYDYNYNQDMRLLEHERDEWAEVARNKDNKLISAIGTMGVSAVAGALSFCTFKTVAPKGYQTLKAICKTVANNSLVKKTSGFVSDQAKNLAGKIKKLYSNINPETKVGKVKGWVEQKSIATKEAVSPVLNKMTTKAKEFAQKHNIDKTRVKEAIKNVGATAVAIPAAVTASNNNEDEMGGEY